MLTSTLLTKPAEPVSSAAKAVAGDSGGEQEERGESGEGTTGAHVVILRHDGIRGIETNSTGVVSRRAPEGPHVGPTDAELSGRIQSFAE